MAYIPDPAVITEPIDGRPAGTAAAEFRALKAYLAGLLGLPSGLAFTQPNLAINPNWNIDQINEGALYTVNAPDVRTVDGWSGTIVGAGVFKVRRLADPDNAAFNCLEITCTTADAAIAAADDYFLYTAIEGYDAAALQAGTANAQQLTVAFKFKTNVPGVYGISVANSALNRSYVSSITVADANEHDYTVTLTMDTAGAWVYNNGVGLYLRICLASGTNFQKAAGAWGADNMRTIATQVNFMGNIANIAYLKRIQIVRGSSVLPAPPADIRQELQRCQRYYCKTFNQGVAPAQAVGNAAGALSSPATNGVVDATSTFRYPVEMRAAPTIITYNPFQANANWRNLANTADDGVNVAGIGTTGVVISGAGVGLSAPYAIHISANARIS